MMMSLRWRFVLSHILPLLLVMPLIGIVFVFLLESQVILVNLSTQLERQARMIAEFVVDSPQIWVDPAAAAQLVDRFDPLITAYISLLQADGRLLATSDPSESQGLGQYVTDMDMSRVQQGVAYHEVHYSGKLDDDVVDIFVPVSNPDSGVIGVIRLTQTLSTVYARFQRVRLIVFWVLTPGLIFGIGIGVVLAMLMERPLTALTGQISDVTETESTWSAVTNYSPLPERGPNEIRRLTHSFNQLIAHLQTLEVERYHLLVNLIHELARPLGAVRSAIDALRGGAVEDPQLRQRLLVGIDGEIQRLQRTLNDLSLLSHLAADEISIVRRPISMSPWLHTTLSPWSEDIQKREIHWREDLPDSLPTLSVDPDRLGQVLGNLLSNAIKYTPKEGTIAVEAGTTDSQLYIHVRDSGPGIPLQEQPHIFEPFYRSHATAQGMGVGLTIARDLVEAHGGHLTVESVPDQGSRFTIWLPLEE
jgi:signal transduction histidine kinase